MSNKDNIISQWMESQNNEFLEQVSCSYVFLCNQNKKYTRKPFALISQNGGNLKIIDGVETKFYKTFSPNYGIYKGSYTISSYNKDINNYHSLYPQEYQYYEEQDSTKLTDNNQETPYIYVGISFLENQALLSITNTLVNIYDQGTPIFLIPIVFKS